MPTPRVRRLLLLGNRLLRADPPDEQAISAIGVVQNKPADDKGMIVLYGEVVERCACRKCSLQQYDLSDRDFLISDARRLKLFPQ